MCRALTLVVTAITSSLCVFGFLGIQTLGQGQGWKRDVSRHAGNNYVRELGLQRDPSRDVQI
jgi:hypothetical protein